MDAWYKASYSGNAGCVEVRNWVKSTLCAAHECVEVSTVDETWSVRDSKNPEGPILDFTKEEWEAFITGVKAGEFDLKA